MLVPGVGYVEVYLVRHYLDAVAEADLAHAGELLARPDSARGVLRAAKYVELDLLLLYLSLHVLEVEDVLAALLDKLAAHQAAAVLLYGAVKRRVRGEIEQYAVPRLRQRAHAAADGEHEAVGLEQPLRLNVPAVAALHPRDYLALEALGRSGVAEGARGDVALERCGYLGREGELHLRDAEVYGVRRALPKFSKAPPHGSAAANAGCRVVKSYAIPVSPIRIFISR